MRYGEYKALIAIQSLVVLQGQLSPRAFGLVMEWAALHQVELLDDWNLVKQNAPQKIVPLE